jgi:HEAT repeat protein
MDGATRKRILATVGGGMLATLPLGCTGPVGTTATSMLSKVKESNDPNVRHMAYAKLGSPKAYDDESQKIEVAKVLSDKLANGSEPVASRVAICRTLGELGRPEARNVILKAINDRDEAEIRTVACRALGRVGKPEDVTVLAQIMVTDPDLDTRIAAIEGMASMKTSDPRIDLMLVDGMEHTEPAIRLASLKALQTLSGQDLGADPAPWKIYAEERMKSAAPGQSSMATMPMVKPPR